MEGGLRAERFGSLEEQERALEALRPGLPWLAWSPARGKSTLREHEPWLLAPEGAPEAAAAAIVRRGRRFSGLDVAWAGPDARPEALLPLLPEFARSRNAPRVILEALGTGRPLPEVSGETSRTRTAVYCVDLSGPEDPESRLGKNHRRNLRRARKEGVARIQQDDAEAVATHARLCRSSFDRREQRGEKILSDTPSATYAAALRSGHGRIHQVGRDGEVLSSNLVIRVADSAYYVSGGTHPDGMKIGSSHLLMLEILEELRADGVRTLNLGYTDTEALARFKVGFGAERVEVERVFADLGPFWARTVRQVIKRVRRMKVDADA
ncbi:MAG: GNAT family N-acetyltransferase [Myxococcota bacterium]|nr:GNAT family N-acetyltransferase [Myxococcota bacterium]